MIQDLETVKSKQQQTQEELEKEQIKNQGLNTQHLELTTQKDGIQKELESQQNINNEINTQIDELTIQTDKIVLDLVSVKESKCWIYTKPIRDLQKILKGNDV